MKKIKEEVVQEDYKNNNDEIREVIIERKSGFNIPEVIIIIIISMLFGVIIGGIITYNRKSIDNNVSNELGEFVSTYNNIVENYYEEIDKDKLLDAAIEGMITSLGDEYSIYMDSSETESFNETVDGSYAGIGATVAHIDDKNQIVDMFDDSPAEKSGLKVGDIFQKIDNKDVSSMDINELTDLIKGEKGTTINVEVLRGDESINVNVTRDNIEIPSVSSEIYEVNEQKIGYIYVSTFAANTYSQFSKELKSLEKKNISSLIIDLRDNPGGHLNQATKILSLFLSKNKILYQLETKGVKEPIYSSSKEKRNYNVAVLINSNSASASEIVAACFKESYKNSVIVGVNSYGKGTVQQAYQLSNGSSLKFTVQKWLTPNGNWINGVGVTPDEIVELSLDYANNPVDENDNQLQKAIELLSKKDSK